MKMNTHIQTIALKYELTGNWLQNVMKQIQTSDSEIQCLVKLSDSLKEKKNYQWMRLRQSTIGRLDAGQKRAFRVKFEGEGVDDHGGPYSQLFADICAELQSSVVPLFVPSSNQTEAIGGNQDKFIVNPLMESPEDLDRYRFFGRLMGIAMRSNIPLPINLPALFWKPLVGEQPVRGDLESIDRKVVQHLKQLQEISEEEFNENYGPNGNTSLNFTIFAGKTVDLVPGGSTIPVTWENKNDYIDKVFAYKLHESPKQMNAIKEGLANIIPIAPLSIFRWQELEVAVCGNPYLDLDFLKQHTTYTDNLTPSDPHVQYFWNSMQNLKPENHADFLRFVWARSRLPKHLEMNFKIQGPPPLAVQQPDKYLPTSQTCFFSISLPKYTSQETMTDRLLYAIKHCVDMDNDFRI